MIALLIILALIGVITWALVTLLPMPDNFKRLIVIVAIVFAVLYVLYAMGIFPMHDPPVPQVR